MFLQVMSSSWRMFKVFFYYVVENLDLDGHVQRDIKQLMKAKHEDNKFDWSFFTIGTSCAIESFLPDGQYDE